MMEAPHGVIRSPQPSQGGSKEAPEKSKKKGMDRPHHGLAVVITTGTRTALSQARA